MTDFEKIVAVAKKHHLMTLATVSASGEPWVAHCFYAWVPAEKFVPAAGAGNAAGSQPSACGVSCNESATQAGSQVAGLQPVGAFVFTTDPATRHGGEMTACGRVAAGIGLETRLVGKVQGIQIEGEAVLAGSDGQDGLVCESGAGDPNAELEAARKAYFRRFPYAKAMPGLTFWLLRPVSMKLTDNTLGFGTKLVWNA